MKIENGLLAICGTALLAMVGVSFFAGCEENEGSRSPYQYSYLRGAGQGPRYQEICAAGHVYLLFRGVAAVAPKFTAEGTPETCRCEIHGQPSGDC